MTDGSFRMFGTTLRNGSQTAPLQAQRPPQPCTAMPNDDEASRPDTCTMVVSLRDTPGALGRIAATLSNTPVLAMSYVVTGAEHAVAEIRVPRVCATRARNKLSRMVDTVAVTEPLGSPSPAQPGV